MKARRRLDPNAYWLLAMPIALFLIAVSVSLFLLAVAIFCAVGWVVSIAQRDEAAVSEADAVFAAAGAEHREQLAVEERDAVVQRLAEVLDEHSLCPAPLHVVPAQRDGSEYEWAALARVLLIEGGD